MYNCETRKEGVVQPVFSSQLVNLVLWNIFFMALKSMKSLILWEFMVSKLKIKDKN